MPATADPSAHQAHDLPLADRLACDAVKAWLDRRTATALAATGDLNDAERGARQGIEQMRHLHLDDYWYTLVPSLLADLRKAGLLT